MDAKEINIPIDIPQVRKAPNTVSEAYAFAKTLSRIELFNRTKNVHGHIIECGVYKGQGLATLAHLLYTYKSKVFAKQVFGFDTFSGFKSVSDLDHLERNNRDGMLGDVSLDLLQKLLYCISESYNSQDRTMLFPGDACVTIPEFLASDTYKNTAISLLIIDFDLYEPTKTALKLLEPRVVKGGIIAVDDLYSTAYPGAMEALREVMDLSKIELQEFDHDPWLAFWQKN